MNILVDDMGSFPLPPNLDRKLFERAYVIARDAIVNGKDIKKDEFLLNNFYQVVVDSFRKKNCAGLDVVNYPQHYSMYNQFLESIHEATKRGTYRVDEKQAIIPEVFVINEEAKRLSEELGKKPLLRVCITGPMELYLKELGTVSYKDILSEFAETVNLFARNSILDLKYVKTEVVSIDEPSFGFQEISADRDTILDILEKAFDFRGVTKQVHLHSMSRAPVILDVKNIDVLTCEYAASPKNIDSVSRKMLEQSNKQIRVGISRTDINSIIGELCEKGIEKPTAEQLVESEEMIRKRFLAAKEKYGDRFTFTGPDCGLGGWPTQESAQLVLKRTVNAVDAIRLHDHHVRY